MHQALSSQQFQTEVLAECDLYVNFKLQNNNVSRFLYKNLGGLKNSITNILLLILNSKVKSKRYSEDKRNFCTWVHERINREQLTHNYSFAY